MALLTIRRGYPSDLRCSSLTALSKLLACAAFALGFTLLPTPGLTVNYASPLDGSCVRHFWDPQNYGWLSFQNLCGRPIHVAYIANNSSDTIGMSAMDLGSGQTRSTGWNKDEVARKGEFTLYVCPAGYLAVGRSGQMLVRRAIEPFLCKSM
jgi:hypothetical protein